MKRKKISWKTRCASALLRAGFIPYSHAKLMTEDQFLSLFHFDHNILHSTGHLDADRYWNLTPMLIRAHREKTKVDAKIIAKGRRIRRTGHVIELSREMRDFARENPDRAVAEAFVEGTHDGREQANEDWRKEANRPGGALRWRKPPPETQTEKFSRKWAEYVRSTKPKQKIKSRGFDKTRKRKMDGTVVKRD